jgi:DNA polymerase-3 subunit alpha
MKEIERIGLLKMDFLGLSTLTLVADALDQIAATTGERIAMAELPLTDAKTFDLFCEGQTLGIFQFESSGMRQILRQAKPRKFEDLIALNALYRPGPIKGGMIDDFINRKHGRVEVRYELDRLRPILEDTYGVMAYQEQVMRVASDLAGFTLGEADLLRKAMGKKNPALMQAQREKFVAGATGRGISEKKATRVFDLMEQFAGYGFNKSHSTAYALLAYHTAYLKANYPWHFMAALLTIESQNTAKLASYLHECRELRVPILPPDINSSDLAFTVRPDGVRFGLGAVKNVGESAIASLIQTRAAHGRLSSLFQVCEDVDLRLVNKRVLESLIKSGAMDALVPGDAGGPAASAKFRPRLMAALDGAVEYGNRHQRDRDKGQTQLFGGGDEDGGPRAGGALPAAAPWADAQQLAFEKEALGLYLSGHPVDRHKADLAAYGAKSLEELLAAHEEPAPADEEDAAMNGGRTTGRVSEDVAVGGIIASIRPLKTRKGDRMCAFVLDDPYGTVEVVVFPDAFSKAASLIQADALVLVKGRFERDEDATRLLASEILPIEKVREQLAREVVVAVDAARHDRRTFEAVSDVLGRHKGDRRVAFLVTTRTEPPLRVRVDVAGQVRVRPSEQLVADLERICGPGSVTVR